MNRRITYEIVLLGGKLPNGRQNMLVTDKGNNFTNKAKALKAAKETAAKYGCTQFELTRWEAKYAHSISFSDTCTITTYSYYESVKNITAWWNEDKDYPARKVAV